MVVGVDLAIDESCTEAVTVMRGQDMLAHAVRRERHYWAASFKTDQNLWADKKFETKNDFLDFVRMYIEK